MKKMQLFQLRKSREIVLVNLSASEMSEEGEMKAWSIDLNKDISNSETMEVKKLKLTWNDLEEDALLLSWGEIPMMVRKKFKQIMDRIDVIKLKDVEDYSTGVASSYKMR